MIKRIMCSNCKTECEYDNKSVWEGNRDKEEICCPICGSIIDVIFTDQIPVVRIIKKSK